MLGFMTSTNRCYVDKGVVHACWHVNHIRPYCLPLIHFVCLAQLPSVCECIQIKNKYKLCVRVRARVGVGVRACMCVCVFGVW